MRRRRFLTLLALSSALPNTLHAQSTGKAWRIGFISGASAASAAEVLNGFPEGMRELGYAEGTDFTMEWRFAEGQYERFEVFAAEMMSLPVDVIVLGTPAAVRAAQRATSTIPIVMGYSTDPVGNGFVASLARPGGNTTGLASLLEEIVAKQVELLRATVPNAQRLAVLTNPGNSNSAPVLASAHASAKRLGFDLVSTEARTSEEIQNAFATLRDLGAGALIVSADAFFHSQSRMIGELALRRRVPSMFGQREYVEHGGLMAYGERLFDFFKRSAVYVDKISEGSRSERPPNRAAHSILPHDQQPHSASARPHDPAHAPRPRR